MTATETYLIAYNSKNKRAKVFPHGRAFWWTVALDMNSIRVCAILYFGNFANSAECQMTAAASFRNVQSRLESKIKNSERCRCKFE